MCLLEYDIFQIDDVNLSTSGLIIPTHGGTYVALSYCSSIPTLWMIKLKNEDGTIQKDQNGKDLTKLESFNASMRDDRVAGMAVEKHAKNNPPNKNMTHNRVAVVFCVDERSLTMCVPMTNC